MDNIDEPISVVDYNAEWPLLFSVEAERIRIGIDEPITGIEHVGSTSVAGMSGKPIVDLLLGVASMEQAHKVAEQVAQLGYENLGEVFVPGRVYLRRREEYNYNVLIVIFEGELWHYFVLLRDYLRRNPDEVEAYSQSKRSAVESGAITFLSYSQEKGPFLKALAERAIAWHQDNVKQKS